MLTDTPTVKTSKKPFATVLFLIILIPLIFAGCTSDEKSTSTPQSGSSSNTEKKVVVDEGEEAPDFEFTTLDGKTAKLSDYQGKVVLLNFWATWCGYCVEEMPAMQRIIEDYPDVVVLAVNRGDSKAEAATFADEYDYQFVWGLDEDGAIAKLYPANGIPYSVIIDKQGVITTIYEGSAADMYPHFETAVTKAGA